MTVIDISFSAGLDFSQPPTPAPGKWSPTLELADKLNQAMLKIVASGTKAGTWSETCSSTGTNPAQEIPSKPDASSTTAPEPTIHKTNWKQIGNIALGVIILVGVVYFISRMEAPSKKENTKDRDRERRRY